MVRTVRAVGVLVVAAVAGLSACGDGGGNGTTELDTQIRVTVRVDGSGQSGITVLLFEPGGTAALATETTNSSGQATFDDVDAGDYDVEVEVPSDLELAEGHAARREVTVAAGATQTVIVDLVSPGAANVQVVNLGSTSFSPSSVTIDQGMTVRWVNGEVTHNVTPDGHTEWTAVTLTANETFEHTFNNAGSFPYECTLHAGMTGTVTVQ